MSELSVDIDSNAGKSAYLPSNRQQVFEAVYTLISRNIISAQDCFVDLGSGTGDVVLITSGVFGLKSIGIEFDEDLHRIALELFDNLEIKIPDDTLQFINGDYSDTDLLDYDNIDILYNYFSGDLTIPLRAVRTNALFMSFRIHGKTRKFYDKSSIMGISRKNSFLNSLSWQKRRRYENAMIKRTGSWRYLEHIKNTDMFVWRKTAK